MKRIYFSLRRLRRRNEKYISFIPAIEKAQLEERGQERRQPRRGVARQFWDTLPASFVKPIEFWYNFSIILIWIAINVTTGLRDSRSDSTENTGTVVLEELPTLSI